MDGAELKAALRAGERVYGTMFVTARAGRWDHTLQVTELDFVIVDNEHAPYSRSETADWIAKLGHYGIVPFIRVPVPQSHYVTMALDAGAHGVLVPYVETVEQVQEVAGAAKYRPLKGEAVRRAVHAGAFPSDEARRYLEELNRNSVLVIGIESLPAVERLEALISVPGVDAVFVGPNDLSIQLGLPNRYDHPRFLEALTHIDEVCRKYEKPLVIHLFNHDMATYWINRGIRFILFGTDRRALSEGFTVEFEALRHINGGRTRTGRGRSKQKLSVVHSKKGPYD